MSALAGEDGRPDRGQESKVWVQGEGFARVGRSHFAAAREIQHKKNNWSIGRAGCGPVRSTYKTSRRVWPSNGKDQKAGGTPAGKRRARHPDIFPRDLGRQVPLQLSKLAVTRSEERRLCSVLKTLNAARESSRLRSGRRRTAFRP